MALLKHLLASLMILFSLCSCYDTLQEDPPYNYLQQESGFDPQAYPSYLSTIDDGKFKDFIKPITDVLGLISDKESTASSNVQIFNVDEFGAKGDGTDDATEAFEKAWEEACSSKAAAVLLIPEGQTYRLRPIRFSGPCKSPIMIQIYGTLEASGDRSDYKEDGRHWLLFHGVEDLFVDGGGIIDGNGKIWWENSCKVNEDLPCKDAPTALTFYRSKNLVVKNLNIRNAQQIHVSFERCEDVEASNLRVTAPEESPNTDGIHVTHTQNIRLTSSVIGTGDDCISIVSGSENVLAEDITCGPGHGISIGSLGAKNSKAYVSGVTVNGAKLFGTDNGVRIKTWQGGSGSASNIKFENIEMHDVKNPIIIDQNYCDQDEPCGEQRSAVQVKNVVYKNIKGTSASKVAIKFDCSKSHPCQGITLEDVELEYEGDEVTRAICNYVKLTEKGNVFPRCP